MRQVQQLVGRAAHDESLEVGKTARAAHDGGRSHLACFVADLNGHSAVLGRPKVTGRFDTPRLQLRDSVIHELVSLFATLKRA